MGNTLTTEFVSLDGVIEDPGGVEGFEDRDRLKLMEYFETFEWRGVELLWGGGPDG
jgi:hypothetical protein